MLVTPCGLTREWGSKGHSQALTTFSLPHPSPAPKECSRLSCFSSKLLKLNCSKTFPLLP